MVGVGALPVHAEAVQSRHSEGGAEVPVADPARAGIVELEADLRGQGAGVLEKRGDPLVLPVSGTVHPSAHLHLGVGTDRGETHDALAHLLGAVGVGNALIDQRPALRGHHVGKVPPSTRPRSP